MVRPLALVRILERLEIEHMSYSSTYHVLHVSYGQFVAHGVSRKTVRRALKLGEALGLLEIVQRFGIYGGELRPPNQYRLTYLSRNNQPPPDTWKRVTHQIAQHALDRYDSAGRGGISNPGGRTKAGTQFPARPAPVPKRAQKPISPVPQPAIPKTP
jgi:hypothetical protein